MRLCGACAEWISIGAHLASDWLLTCVSGGLTMTKGKTMTLREVVLKVVASVEGDWQKAHAKLMRKASQDHDLMKDLAKEGSMYLVRQVAATDRQRIMRGKPSNIHVQTKVPNVKLPTKTFNERIKAHHGIFAFSLQGGLALGDATIGQVRIEITLRRSLAQKNSRVADWLQGVVDRAVKKGAKDNAVLHKVLDAKKEDLIHKKAILEEELK
jgi:hypothetical protein